MIAVALAVGLAALFAEWRHVPYAQWLVCSAASVVTGDAVSARRTLGDRLVGALVGVPFRSPPPDLIWPADVRQFCRGWSHAWAASEPRRAPDGR